MIRRCLTTTLLLVGFFSSTVGATTSTDFEEATGLLDSPVLAVSNTAANSWFRTRNYVALDGTFQSIGTRTINSIPNFEYGITTTSQTFDPLTVFADGRVIYTQSQSTVLGVLNQVGVRYRPNDNWLISIGKERNRRSPGILVSPSDFIFTQTALPGQREDRMGVWLVRGSYQTVENTLDVFALPVTHETNAGFPSAVSQYRGTVVRGLLRISGIDISPSIAQIGSQAKAGASVQGYVQPELKLYYDGALELTQSGSEHLFGLSFEPDAGYSVKTEYLTNSTPLSPLPYLGGNQFIFVSATAPDFLHCLNLYATSISPVNSTQWLLFSRIELLLGNQWMMGSSVIYRFNAPTNALRSQLTIDATFSF